MSTPTPKEIRDTFTDFRNAWQSVRDEAAADMRCISVEGPWTSEDRQSREDAGRPCIHLDKINPALDKYAGNLRKNKRAIKAMPKGDGANDQDAARRSSLIMGIEDASNAPTSVYIPCAESTAQRSYGFSVIRCEYQDFESFDQQIRIKLLANPDSVLISPYYKEQSACDIEEAFLIDTILKKDFKRKYPDAKETEFSGEILTEVGVSDWVKNNYLQIAEFWKIHYDRSKLLLVQGPDGMPVIFTEDEWKQAKESGVRGEVKRERTIEKPRVVQYMTNGLEILDEVPWAGSRIPIISCLGPERWTTEGGQAKRQLLSMVRFARDPQMLYDFLASGECEEAGQIPKSPFVGAKGQFESDKEAWTEITKIPHAYVEYDPITDATGQNVLPPPSRPQFQANFQQWEVAKDSAERSILSTLGNATLPAEAQRRNQKSGVAIERIDDIESLGSFHFVDRYENGYLHNMGWQINELITDIYDTQREMPITQPDGKRKMLALVGNTSHPLNDQGAYEVQGLPEEHLHTGKGDFDDVTIATGPSERSEREEQSDFVDQLIQNLANLPQPGTPQGKVLALGIRMRPTLGPIGQQIADFFDPPDPNSLPPQAQAVMMQLQSQLQAAQQELIALHADRAGRVLEQQTKVHIEQMKQDNENLRTQLQNDIKVLVAEISAKSQDEQQRAEMYRAFWEENHRAAHEHAMQQDEQAHEHELADKTAANAQELAAQAAVNQNTAQPSQ